MKLFCSHFLNIGDRTNLKPVLEWSSPGRSGGTFKIKIMSKKNYVHDAIFSTDSCIFSTFSASLSVVCIFEASVLNVPFLRYSYLYSF